MSACCRRLVVALAVAALAAGAAVRASGTAWESFVDQQYGFSVSIPKAWCIVPPTASELEALVRRVEKQQGVPLTLAGTYEAFLPSVKQGTYLFQAFQCPLTPWPDANDLAIRVTRTSKPYTASELLHSGLAASFAKQGMKVTRSALVRLGGGRALLVAADWQETPQIPLRVEEFTLLHGKLVVSLSFRADARDPAALATFAAIAARFRFT